MRRLVYRIRRFLTGHEDTKGELKRVLICVHIIGYSIFATLFFSIFDTIFDETQNALLDVFTSIIFVFCLLLISNGWFNAAKFLCVLISSSILFLNSIDATFSYGNMFIWVPILSGTFMVFSLREYVKILVSLVFVFGLIGTHYYLEINNLIIPDSNSNSQLANSIICFSVSIVLVLFYIKTLIDTNDASEQKLKYLNQRLKRTNENLIKTNHELDSFVYRASHDLRSPLASILGLLELSKLETNIDKIREYMMLKERSVKKLDNYILDILNMSRNSRQRIVTRELDVKDLIEDAFNQLSYIETAKRIQLEISYEGTAPFFGDYARISTVISNLLSNGIRYCDTQKPESVIRFKVDSQPDALTLYYFDNGQGIRPEYLPKIFDMYYRANERNSGSGLGLYIVKETLIKMKGSIEANSQFGLWTQFIIRVPNLNSES